jgi:putative PEP-CTERM system TPR-repeat lipoprotein
MLDENPKSEELLLALANLKLATGAPPADVTSLFNKAVNLHPESVRARLALIRYLASRNDRQNAVDAAQAAVNANRDNPELLDALAVVQIATDPRQAIETYKRLIALQPQNVGAYLRLAEIQTAIKDYESALVNERKALTLKPDEARAYVLLARTHVAAGHPQDALAEARKLQKDSPAKALGFAMEGELKSLEKQPVEAAAAFKAALSREPSAVLAMRTYDALNVAGKPAEAKEVVTKWVKDHPKDNAVPLFLAQRDLQRKDFQASRVAYERILERDPGNIVALNNLAWLLVDMKDPKGLDYAERAHRLQPFNASVLDTFGWALIQSGETKRGTELLRMASALAPGNADIELHYARALISAGDKQRARELLMGLASRERSPSAKAEAANLLGTLQ